MKITNCVLHNFWKQEARKNKGLACAQKIETEDSASNCILEILSGVRSHNREKMRIHYKLKIMTIQNICGMVSRGERSVLKILANPLFTQEQIVLFKKTCMKSVCHNSLIDSNRCNELFAR